MHSRRFRFAVSAVLFSLLSLSCGDSSESAAPASAPATVPAKVPATAPAPAPASSSSPKPSVPGGKARLVFEDTVLDFGTVWDVDELVGKFPFRNTGQADLVIKEVKPSCGCTTTELDRMQFAPGEGSSIDVVWNAKGFGNQAKTITVLSNGEGQGVEVLTIRAVIRPFAEFSQNPLRMGVLTEGQVHRQKVRLTCQDPDFEVLELRCGNRYLSANDLGRAADGSHEIELTFAQDTAWGQQTCSVQVKLRGKLEGRDEPIEHTSVLSVSASVFGKLRVEPTMLTVGYVPLGRSFERSVQLKHVDHAAFRVTSARIVDSKPPGMTVTIEPFSQNINTGVILKLSGDAGDYVGLIRGKVVFKTNIPGEQERSVPVMGIIR